MSKHYRSLLLFSLFLVNFAFASLALAYATEPIQIDPSRQDFVIGPGKTDLILNPGESTIVEVMISNRTGEDRDFEIKFEDFTGSKDLTSPVVFTSDSGANTLKDYLFVSEKTFFLKNGERARIPVTVSVPEGAEPGGRYTSILVSTLTPLEKTLTDSGVKGGVPLITQSGTLVFVTIPGEIKREGRLAEFFTQNKASFFSYAKDVVFQLVYENTGKIHLKPSGVISIKNIFGQEVRNIEIDQWFVMPDSLRLREVSMVADPAGDDPFMIGRYTAEANIVRGYDDQSDTLSFAFWIIPWKLLVIILIILLILALLIRLGVRYISSHIEFKKTPKETLPPTDPVV
jgi:hypothetical protein